MKLENVIMLINAGFTKEEIMKLDSNSELEAEVVKEAEEVKEDKEILKSEESKDAIKEEALTDQIFGKLNASIDEFTQKLQSFNAITAEQKDENKTESLEDILARVLTPQGKEI